MNTVLEQQRLLWILMVCSTWESAVPNTVLTWLIAVCRVHLGLETVKQLYIAHTSPHSLISYRVLISTSCTIIALCQCELILCGPVHCLAYITVLRIHTGPVFQSYGCPSSNGIEWMKLTIQCTWSDPLPRVYACVPRSLLPMQWCVLSSPVKRGYLLLPAMLRMVASWWVHVSSLHILIDKDASAFGQSVTVVVSSVRTRNRG